MEAALYRRIGHADICKKKVVAWQTVPTTDEPKPGTPPSASASASASGSGSGNGDWPGWRGAQRDGRVAWLPSTLPEDLQPAWTAELTGEGVGGIAVSDGCVIVGSRDVLDRSDVFQCFDQKSGDLLWQHFYPARGALDYGNSPRATPLIHDGLVYTLGAFGDLYCIELESGLPFWKRNLATDFQAQELTWGHSGSPIIVDGKLIVQPGGEKHTIVALDPETGELIWSAPGISTGYSSLIAGTYGGVSQVIGYDAASLGGWDVATGKRLWSLIPPEKGDFNVPTVVPFGPQVLVSTENNGTRCYGFAAGGRLLPEPVAVNSDLTPDSHTPVLSGGRLFGIWNELWALDAKTLETTFSDADDSFAVYGSLIASDDRLLGLTANGELLLISTDADTPSIVSRRSLAKPGVDVLSHPAVAGTAVYLRVGRTLHKFPLK